MCQQCLIVRFQRKLTVCVAAAAAAPLATDAVAAVPAFSVTVFVCVTVEVAAPPPLLTQTRMISVDDDWTKIPPFPLLLLLLFDLLSELDLLLLFDFELETMEVSD